MKWSIDIWTNGCELDSQHVFDGSYSAAIEYGARVVDQIFKRTEGAVRVTYDVYPYGLMTQVLPTGFRVDEVLGTLRATAAAAEVDPLPRVAIRHLARSSSEKDSAEIRVVLEDGLRTAEPVLPLISAVLGRHLGAGAEVSERTLEAARVELEDRLARLVARGALKLDRSSGIRKWAAA